MIRVLVVDDSPTFRLWLRTMLARDPEIVIAAEASDGYEAVQMAKKQKPDIITMDIHMPGMGGYDAIEQIMEAFPAPIVVLSSAVSRKEMSASFRALEAGAVAVLPKPTGHVSDSNLEDEILMHLKSLSKVSVVRRRGPKAARKSILDNEQKNKCQEFRKGTNQKFEIIAMGASAGGPQAIQQILTLLPDDIPVPIVITMHISDGFIHSFGNWLGRVTGTNVVVAEEGMSMQAGTVYLAPDEAHMLPQCDQTISLRSSDPVDNFIPSITAMFRETARQFGGKALGILLTGMGRDGATGLKAVLDQGGYTIVQDKQSAMIDSMPQSAIELQAANEICPLDLIANRICELLNI